MFFCAVFTQKMKTNDFAAGMCKERTMANRESEVEEDVQRVGK